MSLLSAAMRQALSSSRSYGSSCRSCPLKQWPARSKRFAAYCEDAVVKVLNISENAHGEVDPAGDDFPESSCVDNMLKCIDKA